LVAMPETTHEALTKNAADIMVSGVFYVFA
jgi:hypothetical protein